MQTSGVSLRSSMSSSQVSAKSGFACSLRDVNNKAVIALNNISVSLLVRGSYREALATVKDAMKLTKSTATHDEGLITAEEIHLTLDRARKRSALCGETASTGALAYAPLLHVVSSQDSTLNICARLAMWKYSALQLHVFFPMTIDPIDYQDCDNDDVEFHSAVILYNFGIVCACSMANARTDDKSYRIFHLTNALTSRMSQSIWERASICFANRVLLLTSLSTHNLFQALSVQGDQSLEYQAHNDCGDMEKSMFLHIISVYRRLFPILTETRTAPAA